MIIEKTGNLFDSTANVLGHGVNCQGVMGAGIAAQFRHNWQEMFREYRNRCLNDELNPGDAYLWTDGTDVIANIASQDKPGADATLSWLLQGLVEAFELMLSSNLHSIALPQIASGIGGLDWESEVKPIIEAISMAYPTIEIELWTFAPK